jgi:hypothetical protein
MVINEGRISLERRMRRGGKQIEREWPLLTVDLKTNVRNENK